MRWTRVTGLVLVLLLLVSCGGDDGQDESADSGRDVADEPDRADDEEAALSGGDVDPCSLLTDAEVEQVAGRPPNDEPGLDEQAAIGMAVCTWDVSTDDDLGGQRFVQVAVHQTARLTDDQQDGGVTARYIAEQNLASVDAEEVEGLGYEAWFTAEFGTYVLLSDDLVLNVSASALFGGSDEPEEREATGTATALALANLESQLG